MRYSSTGGQHHKRLTALYALLEDRLPVAPLCPNDALDTLLCLLPADTHHNGVVDHLVRIISGNACCIDPLLCLAVIERLLVPALPCWLTGQCMVAENRSSGDDAPAAEISDAALMMALAPLGRVLSRCVVVYGRLRLGEKGHITASLCCLRGWHTTHPGTLSQQSHDSGARDDSGSSSLLRVASVLMSFTAQRWHWDCSGSEQCAVVDSCIRNHRHRESSERWHACGLVALVHPVVRYLYEVHSQANDSERLAARTGLCASFPAAAATLRPSRWSTVRSLGQQCWWWSTVVCRATPVIPSTAVRAFAVGSLVDVVHKLHRALVPCVAPCELPWLRGCSGRSPQLPSPETLWPCLAMLERLLVGSVPVLRDESDADAPWRSLAESKGNEPPTRPSEWTAELRRGWWLLGGDFACLSAAALEHTASSSNTVCDVGGERAADDSAPGESESAAPLSASPPLQLRSTGACARSNIVRVMANVGYRLALQWAAVVTPLATAVAVSKLAEGTLDEPFRHSSPPPRGVPDGCQHQRQMRVLPTCELKVILRLLRVIASARPALLSSALTISSGSSAAADVVFVEETTWCKLACLVNLLRCCPADRAESSDRHAGAVPAGAAAEDSSPHCVQCSPSAVDAMHEHQEFVRLQEQRLLHSGLVHVMACTSISAPETASYEAMDEMVHKNAAALGHAVTSPPSSAYAPPSALPDPSAEFLCALLKCWRTWTMDWPLPLHVTWMQELASAAAAAATPVSAGEEGGDERGSRGGRAPAAGAAAAMAVPHFALSEAADVACDRPCRSMQRLLCSLLTNAWAASTDMRHDRDPLDLCACWCAFSAVSRPPRCASATELPLSAGGNALPSTCGASLQLSRQHFWGLQGSREDEWREQLALMAAASEDRFCCMCETRLKQLGGLSGTRIEEISLKAREQRPVLRQPTFARGRERGWLPICLPAIVSHIGLRVLYRSRPVDTARATPSILHGDVVAAEPPHISEFFVAMVRSAVLSPAAGELAAFQLSMVSRYAEWCEAAGVHTGWCACAVQAYPTTGGTDGSDVSCISVEGLVGPPSSATGMPWWVLTVDGLAVRGGVKDGVDVATILFLWEHGVGAAASPAAGVRPSGFFEPHHNHCGGCASAIKPLMPSRLRSAGGGVAAGSPEASPNEMDSGTLGAPPDVAAELDEEDGDGDDSEDEQWGLRRSLLGWGHRYALRLILFEVVEGQWHRFRSAELARRSQQQLVQHALCDPQRQRCRGLASVREEFAEEGARFANGAHAVEYATSAYRTAVSGPGIAPHYMWHSDAYQPLLRLVAECATRVVDRLAAEVLAAASATTTPGRASYPKAQSNESRKAGRPAAAALVMSLAKAKLPEQWTARLTAHLWSELRCGSAEATVAPPVHTFPCANHTGLHGSHHRSLSTAAGRLSHCRQLQSCGLACSEAVVRLEELLCGLGLVSASKKRHACRTPCGLLSTEDVAEESHALLASLLLSPELVCTSSVVIYFANAILWRRCWASLMATSSAAAHHNSGSMPGGLEGLGAVTAQLDALVTFRVILRCMEQVQRFVQELVEYLCCVFVPAVQADHCAARLTSTPVEAMQRRARTSSSSASHGPASPTAHPEYASTAKRNRHDGRYRSGKFSFSWTAVRTFEVLCLGRCGDELRAPCVWQQWTRELIRQDRVLCEHSSVQSTSQWRS
ncbi:hypothetical protein JIQ42_05012 [Leishmania sp. Namibia]|uniref:hypothetical protein n=1 Tax=Leishmania sp. Namibia TaxID=2802991 RepID=UPI001B63EE6C|nr:hypothetical protein JIQ42_05012 [Leishmania sp. Namibia]